jgi:hypothetical protein
MPEAEIVGVERVTGQVDPVGVLPGKLPGGLTVAALMVLFLLLSVCGRLPGYP